MKHYLPVFKNFGRWLTTTKLARHLTQHPRRFTGLLLLCGLCIFAYANSLPNAFISDDVTGIQQEPLLTNLWHWWLRPHEFLNALSWQIGKFNVIPYHLMSILSHCVVTVLVFYFVRRWCSEEASLYAAAVFAVHPIHVEAVAWISGRTYVVITFFILLTYFLYAKACQSAAFASLRSRRYYLAALAIFIYYSWMNYTFYSLFLVLIVLVDVYEGRWRTHWKWWVPFFLILALRLFLARQAINDRMEMALIQTGETAVGRHPFFHFIYSIFGHLSLLLWPGRLTIYHEPIIFSPTKLFAGAVALLAGASFLPLLLKRGRLYVLAAAGFVLFLSPTYSPWPLSSTVAERYAYPASIFFVLTIGYAAEQLLARAGALQRKLLIGVGISLLAACSARTIVRNEDWRSPNRFWRATAEVSPESHRAHNNLGLIYVSEENPKRAIDSFMRSLQINPDAYDTYNNLGALYRDLGKRQEAISYLKKAMELNPKLSAAEYNLAMIYSDMDKPDEAIAMLHRSIELNPRNLAAYTNLGNVYMGMGRLTEALEAYRKSITIDPRYGLGYYNLANVYQAQGKSADAVTALQKAVKESPRYAPAYSNLGVLYNQMGRVAEAEGCLRKALSLDPGYLQAYNNLGNLYNQFGMKQEAVDIFLRALTINPNYAMVHFNLATAYFDLKQYDEAVASVDKAIALGYKAPEGFLKMLEPYRPRTTPAKKAARRRQSGEKR